LVVSLPMVVVQKPWVEATYYWLQGGEARTDDGHVELAGRPGRDSYVVPGYVRRVSDDVQGIKPEDRDQASTVSHELKVVINVEGGELTSRPSQILVSGRTSAFEEVGET
jgi:hypothetical protein